MTTRWRDENYQVEAQVTPLSLPSGKRLEVTVHSRKGFTAAEAKKHETAVQMLEELLNTVEFKTRFTALKFTSTKDTSATVYKNVMGGSEKQNNETDNELDVYVEMYYTDNRIVGYTNPSTKTTWLNRKFFGSYGYASIAANCFHEWLHKIGYGHASASDSKSVPYAGGHLVNIMVGEMVKGRKFTQLIDVAPVEPITPPPTKPGEIPAPIPPTETPVPPASPIGKLVCTRLWYTLWTVKVCKYT